MVVHSLAVHLFSGVRTECIVGTKNASCLPRQGTTPNLGLKLLADYYCSSTMIGKLHSQGKYIGLIESCNSSWSYGIIIMHHCYSPAK